MDSFLYLGGLFAVGAFTTVVLALNGFKIFENNDNTSSSGDDLNESSNDKNNNKTKNIRKNSFDQQKQLQLNAANNKKSDLAFHTCVLSLILFLTMYSYKRIFVEKSNKTTSFMYAYIGFFMCLLGNLLFLVIISSNHQAKIFKEEKPFRSFRSVGILLLLIASLKVCLHFVLEAFCESLPLNLHPMFTAYFDILFVNIFLDQFWTKTIKCKEQLNQYLGLNYIVWIMFTVFLCILEENLRFLTISQLYWHGLTIVYVVYKINFYTSHRKQSSGYDFLFVFDLVRSKDYYFLLIPLRVYGLFKIAHWLF